MVYFPNPLDSNRIYRDMGIFNKVVDQITGQNTLRRTSCYEENMLLKANKLSAEEKMSAGIASDLSLYKRRKLSQFERVLCQLIQRADEVANQFQTRCQPAPVNPQYLRQQMRNIRRWRNGSLVFGDIDEDNFEEFLKTTRLEVIAGEVESLRQELEGTEDNQDGNCTILREDMDEDIRELEEHVPLVKDPDEIDAMENRISELKQTMLYLHSELSEVCSSISEHDSSFGETLEERLYVFEAHPARNRVLSLADRIRDMLKLLKDGAHATSNDVTCLEDPDGCCSNDIDVLRRQLRKMRRWQQNVVHFVTDDVVDLELIIGAIEKHICLDSPDSQKSGMSGMGCRRGDSSYGTMREVRLHDVDLEDSTSASENSTDVTSGFSELPVSKLETSRLTGGCAGLGSMSSLDENADFGERLI